MFSPLNAILGLMSRDMESTSAPLILVLVRGKGVVINEPSVVAINKRTRKVLEVGAAAKRMVGVPCQYCSHSPLKDGVISDFDVTEQMLHYFIGRVHEEFTLIPRPRVVIGIPSGVTEVERRAVHDAACSAGAREALIIEEPMAAAIGAGLRSPSLPEA